MSGNNAQNITDILKHDTYVVTKPNKSLMELYLIIRPFYFID